MPSSDVNGDTVDKIIGRRVSKDSTAYTNASPLTLFLSAAGYRHKTVNHSAGEYLKGGGSRKWMLGTEALWSGCGWHVTGACLRTT